MRDSKKMTKEKEGIYSEGELQPATLAVGSNFIAFPSLTRAKNCYWWLMIVVDELRRERERGDPEVNFAIKLTQHHMTVWPRRVTFDKPIVVLLVDNVECILEGCCPCQKSPYILHGNRITSISSANGESCYRYVYVSHSYILRSCPGSRQIIPRLGSISRDTARF